MIGIQCSVFSIQCSVFSKSAFDSGGRAGRLDQPFIMKYLFIACCVVSGATVCFSQDDSGVGTPDPGATNVALEWNVCLAGTNAVPANDSPFKGGGTLSLSGGVLNYQVRLPFPNLSPT